MRILQTSHAQYMRSTSQLKSSPPVHVAHSCHLHQNAQTHSPSDFSMWPLRTHPNTTVLVLQGEGHVPVCRASSSSTLRPCALFLQTPSVSGKLTFGPAGISISFLLPLTFNFWYLLSKSSQRSAFFELPILSIYSWSCMLIPHITLRKISIFFFKIHSEKKTFQSLLTLILMPQVNLPLSTCHGFICSYI